MSRTIFCQPPLKLSLVDNTCYAPFYMSRYIGGAWLQGVNSENVHTEQLHVNYPYQHTDDPALMLTFAETIQNDINDILNTNTRHKIDESFMIVKLYNFLTGIDTDKNGIISIAEGIEYLTKYYSPLHCEEDFYHDITNNIYGRNATHIEVRNFNQYLDFNHNCNMEHQEERNYFAPSYFSDEAYYNNEIPIDDSFYLTDSLGNTNGNLRSISRPDFIGSGLGTGGNGN